MEMQTFFLRGLRDKLGILSYHIIKKKTLPSRTLSPYPATSSSFSLVRAPLSFGDTTPLSAPSSSIVQWEEREEIKVAF